MKKYFYGIYLVYCHNLMKYGDISLFLGYFSIKFYFLVHYIVLFKYKRLRLTFYYRFFGKNTYRSFIFKIGTSYYTYYVKF